MPIACMQAACAAGPSGEPAEASHVWGAMLEARMKANTAGMEHIQADQLKVDEVIKEIAAIIGNKVRQIASFWVAP